MPRESVVTWSGDLPGTPEQAWDAVTRNTSAWLWPISYEPRSGGAESGLNRNGGTVTVWEPHRRFTVVSAEGDNTLEYRFDEGRLDFRHTGQFDDAELDACRQHTDFYYHSLREYLGHFAGRPASFTQADSPDGVSWVAMTRALGVPDGAGVGDRVRLTPEGSPPVDGVIDYRTAAFLGVRSDDALLRFFGRDVWGWPVGTSAHVFASGEAL